MKKLDKKNVLIALLLVLVIFLGVQAYVQPYVHNRRLNTLRSAVDRFILYRGSDPQVRDSLIKDISLTASRNGFIKAQKSFAYIDFPICSFLAWRISEVTEFGDGYYNPETEVYWPGEPINTSASDAAVHAWVTAGCLNGLEF